MIRPALAAAVALAIALSGGLAAQPADQSAAKARAAAQVAQLEAALGATRTERGTQIVLPADALFGPAGAKIEPGAEPQLAQLAQLIAAAKPREVTVAGHTDGVGGDDENLSLSQERARAVAAWLKANTPKPGPRLVENGYGRTRPRAPNHHPDGSVNAEGRERNRRIEVTLRR